MIDRSGDSTAMESAISTPALSPPALISEDVASGVSAAEPTTLEVIDSSADSSALELYQLDTDDEKEYEDGYFGCVSDGIATVLFYRC